MSSKAESSKAPSSKEATGISTLFGLIPFLQGSWLELQKVHHPTRQETIQTTMVVMAMLVTVALFLGAVDLLLGWLMHLAMAS